MVQGLYSNSRFLVRFQYWYEKYITSNQLTVVTVEKNSVNKKFKFPTISTIPTESIYL